jgi:hypothetical protein
MIALIAALVTNDADRPSGSGSNPMLVRIGESVTGIKTVLVAVVEAA